MEKQIPNDENEATEDDDSNSDEPLRSIFQTRRVRAGENCSFSFQMETGQQLVGAVSSDEYVNVSICSEKDFKKWLDGKELMEYEGEEEVRDCELPLFTAPRDGSFLVAIMNHSHEDADVTVDIAIWPPDEDED